MLWFRKSVQVTFLVLIQHLFRDYIQKVLCKLNHGSLLGDPFRYYINEFLHGFQHLLFSGVPSGIRPVKTWQIFWDWSSNSFHNCSRSSFLHHYYSSIRDPWNSIFHYTSRSSFQDSFRSSFLDSSRRFLQDSSWSSFQDSSGGSF